MNTTKGMLRASPKRSRKRFPLLAAPTASILSMDMLMSATMMIQRAWQMVAASLIPSSSSAPFHQQLDAIQMMTAPPASFTYCMTRSWDTTKVAGHPDDNGAARTERDSPKALLPGQVLDGHGDHDRIVAGEDQVDEHDAQKGHDEFHAEVDPAQPYQNPSYDSLPVYLCICNDVQ